MERAVDPELLRLALGEHESLPSPEELSKLLASAELALLLRKPEISDRLLITGWYLHAVASSRYALRIYGVSRQRAAFKVAGHIFDLLLQSADLGPLDRLKYCFASQIAYLRGELDPNALAIYDREFPSGLAEPDLLMEFQEVALSCAVAFLGMDTAYVYEVAQNLRGKISDLLSSWDLEDISATPFGSAANVAFALRDLMTFLTRGAHERLDGAIQLLLAAVLAESSAEDTISRWVAAHLLSLAGDLRNASVWTVLPPDVPSRVRRAFAMGSPRVVALWPPQLDLLGRGQLGGINLLSPQAKRVFLSTPTSGGKTLLAQLLVACHLATEPTSVCYVAPARSLCREIRRSLESRMRFIGRPIVDSLPEGDWLDDIVDFQPAVEVMTPERLSYLIRSDSCQVLDRFGMFIFDEVHLVGESGRGWTLEEDLSYLHYATQGKHHRIILMSAAVGNQHHFVQWLGGDENGVIHRHSPWRGPRSLHAIWRTEPSWEASSIEEVPRATKFPRRESCPLYGRLDIRVSHTGEFHSLRTVEPIGVLIRKIRTNGRRETDSAKTTSFYRMLIPIILHLSASGPVLVIEATRSGTVRMARAIGDAQHLPVHSELRSLIDLVEERLGPEHPLSQILRKGVAYHHGSLPSEIRAAIEESVTQGHLKFLVATTTMTEGVNLPVRSVVIASQGFYSADGYVEHITGSRLINAIGRAGRATKETEGVVVLARPAAPSPADFERLSPADTEIQVTSMLATAKALEALAGFEELQRTAVDAVFQTAHHEVSSFIAFVWFIAAELEQIGALPDEEHIVEVLEHSLAWQQLEPEDQARWLSVAQLTLARYHKTPPPARRRWPAAGTSIHSARELETIAQQLAQTLTNVEIPRDPVDILDLIIGNGRLERLLDLPEAPTRKAYTHRASRNRREIAVRLDALLRQWLQGLSLVNLANTHFSAVADIDFRFAQLGDFINDYFEVFLPWVLGTVIAWTNDLLQDGAATTLFPRTIPAYVRWGVGNPTALGLIVRGIQSRGLALKIATAWGSEKREGDVRSWIRSMNLVEWKPAFQASVAELRNLLEYSRDDLGGIAADLITEETGEIEVESSFLEWPPSPALLAAADGSDLSPTGIWVQGQLVARVRSKDQADIQSLLSMGLPLALQFSASSGQGRLKLRLVNPAS